MNRRLSRGFRRALSLGALGVCFVLCACSTAGDGEDLAKHLEIPEWRIASAPSFRIGDDVASGRVLSAPIARRYADDDVLIAEQSDNTVREYRRDGSLVRTLARSGNGPGEISGAFRVAIASDTLFILGQPPASDGQVTVLPMSGAAPTRFQPGTPEFPIITAMDRLEGGPFLVRRGMPGFALSAPPIIGRLVHDSAQFGLYNFTGPSAARVQWFPKTLLETFYGYRWRNSRLGSALGTFEFEPGTLFVVSGKLLWMIRRDDASLAIYDIHGAQLRQLRPEIPRHPFDTRLLNTAQGEALRNAVRLRDTDRVLGNFDPAIRPALMPVLAGAVAGADGAIWIQLFSLETLRPTTFILVSAAGVLEGMVRVPANIDVQQFGTDYLLGVQHLENGDVAVVEYSINRD